AGLAVVLGEARTLDLADGALVAVINPCGGARTETVTGALRLPDELVGKPLVAIDPDGNRTPCQSIGLDQVALLARVVPSVGYQTLSIQVGESETPDRRYSLGVADDGRLRITHLTSGHVINGAHLLIDEADAGDEYTFCPIDQPATINQGRPARTWIVRDGP